MFYRLRKLENGGGSSKSILCKRSHPQSDDGEQNGNGDVSPAKKQKWTQGPVRSPFHFFSNLTSIVENFNTLD